MQNNKIIKLKPIFTEEEEKIVEQYSKIVSEILWHKHTNQLTLEKKQNYFQK